MMRVPLSFNQAGRSAGRRVYTFYLGPYGSEIDDAYYFTVLKVLAEQCNWFI